MEQPGICSEYCLLGLLKVKMRELCHHKFNPHPLFIWELLHNLLIWCGQESKKSNLTCQFHPVINSEITANAHKVIQTIWVLLASNILYIFIFVFTNYSWCCNVFEAYRYKINSINICRKFLSEIYYCIKHESCKMPVWLIFSFFLQNIDVYNDRIWEEVIFHF